MPYDPEHIARFALAEPRAHCAVFRKTAEKWGQYSTMAPKFPVTVNGIRIRTCEALYQACRFPKRPDVQREIIDHASPMGAKMTGKPHRQHTRPDFQNVCVSIMWWALRVKLACNRREFSRILLASGELPIVEDSHRDRFWGAVPVKGNNEQLVGQNVLGQLLMALREFVRDQPPKEALRVEPLAIKDFLLYGEPIGVVQGRD